MKRFFIKLFKVTGLSIAGFLLLLFLIPILFPGTVSEKIKSWTNNSLDGELNFSKVRLSFFKHFPSLTVTLHDFTLKGSAPFKKDTLVAADEISLGINIKSLIFDSHINIDKIFISDALMNVEVNEKGEANYNVYVDNKKKAANNADTSSTALRLEKIIVENSHLIYNDKSIDILINAKGFNYSGNGDLSKAIFDLYSHAKIDSLDFSFGKEAYLLNKQVNADLITKINTNSLAFFFQKNSLVINRLPVEFNGKLDFLKNGYDIDFTVTSEKSKLDDFITALPPQYITWEKQTDIKGVADILLTLKGQYIASTGAMPDLAFNMKIRDGYIKYKNSPLPASNIFLNLDTKMPAINQDSLLVKVDSIFFNLDKEYFSAIITTKGVERPFVNAKINAQLDLQKLDQALGLPNVSLRGKTDIHFTANGLYASGPNPNSLRHETVLRSIPSYNLQATVKDGYFKYDSLPQEVNNINFVLNSACPDSNYQHIGFSIKDLSATALNNFIKGYASVGSLQNKDVDANLQANINLSEVKKIYPIDSTDISGLLKIAINAKGKYDDKKKTFPATTADINLKNGLLKTKHYPNAINDIQITAKATDDNGSLKNLAVVIEPASFNFEGKPFHVKASLQNFEDIAYAITANGELDIAKIYKVFSRKGIDVSGYIKADLSLQGRQSDATHGRYSQLRNQGTLEAKDLQIVTENFPQPFLIKEGLFTFKQDKMWFRNFIAAYGQSDFKMDGYMQNVIDYALSNNAVLKGNFAIKANYINADEFMAFAPAKTDANNNTVKTVAANTTPVDSGVIIIPSNLDLTLQANAQKVDYNGLHLQDVKGNVAVKQSKLTLKETGFNLIGCNVLMDADYNSTSPYKALFDYHLKATDFDIKKAYNEVKLFHDMATSAGKAQGIVSLDYNLKGVLDGNMHPIYPSLDGGGVLSIKNVKVYGLKLFSTVSQKTGKDSINNPSMAKVDIKTTIKNNIITIERFKFKVAGFRPRIEGQTSFDGKLNIKMRLGLPPLGIIGIPMRITGTQDNPKVKIGKGDEELEETEYKDDSN
ncbi:MAG: AsmA family protein [Chitinophagaceae bacterium]